MFATPIPVNETERLAVLRTYAILDTPSDPAFERVVALAARTFGVPMAAVVLVDQKRLWLKAAYGLTLTQLPRPDIFCSHTILETAPLIVPDATRDVRFADSPLVIHPPYARFYAGVPLLTPDGFALGTLAVLDSQPRHLSAAEVATLRDLALFVCDLLELHRLRHTPPSPELRYRDMVEHSPLITYTRPISVMGNPTYISPQVTALLGYSPDMWATDPDLWHRTIFAEDRERVTQAIVQAVVFDSVLQCEYRRVAHDGQIVWVRDDAQTIYDAAGQPLYIHGVLTHLAERAAQEEARHRQDAYLALTQETALALAGGLDAIQLLTIIVRHANGLFGAAQGFLYLREPGDSHMQVRIGIGYDPQYDFPPVPLGVGIAGTVWQTGQPVIIANYSAWPNRLPDLLYDTMQCVVGVPLIVEGDVIGVLGITSFEPGRLFSDADIATLERFAQLAALAIQNARLFEATQRHVTELATIQRVTQVVNSTVRLQEVFQTVVHQTSAAFGYTMVSIYLRDGDGLTLQAYTGYDTVISHLRLTEGVMGRVARTGKAAFVPDARRDPDFLYAVKYVEQAIIVPLIGKANTVLGILAVESSGQPRLTESDFTVMQLLAAQVSGAIENAYLFAELERSEEKYREVVNTVKEVIFQTDTEGCWVFLNPAWTELMGYTVAESLGRPFLTYIHPDDQPRTLELAGQLFARQIDEVHHEMRYVTKEGLVRWFALHGRLRLSADGVILGTSGTLADISELRQAMQQAMTAQTEVAVLTQANALKSKFMAVVSHELRTPLTGILGFAELLTARTVPPNAVRDYAEKIVYSAERIKAMIDEYLNLQRLEAGAEEFVFARVDIAALLTETTAMADDSHPFDLQLAPVGPVRADHTKLRRVIENLLNNAAKYSPTGSPITISLIERDDEVEIRVRDRGIGIPPEAQPHIFEKFYRGRSVAPAHNLPGTGLGLAISKEIVEQHGGSIGFETHSSGTTFWVRLPRGLGSV